LFQIFLFKLPQTSLKEAAFSKRYHELIFVARIACSRYFCPMPRTRFNLLPMFALLLSASAFCSDWGGWQNVRSLYDSGKFPEALQALKNAPSADASYYYNLGNIYYRLGQVGLAVANLEVANRKRPRDSDIQNNLKVAKTALAKTLGEDRVDPASSWLETVADTAPLDEIRLIIGLSALLVAMFLVYAYLRERNLRKTLLRPISIVLLTIFALSGSLYLAQRLASSNPPAISTEQQIIRSGPGEQFVELGRVEAGVRLRLLGPSIQTGQDLWRQVRYARDGLGWAKASSLLPL
jgi:tetratricopeptide (TPR) repeat protein